MEKTPERVADAFGEYFKGYKESALAELAATFEEPSGYNDMVLLKDITDRDFVFYTNYGSAKGREIESAGKAAFVLHWKSLLRQIRVRGTTAREQGTDADAYFASRSLKSKLGAWASRQSEPLASRLSLMAEVARVTAARGTNPTRPPFWGGVRICPTEIEFWADGTFRLHDRFLWRRLDATDGWTVQRLNP